MCVTNMPFYLLNTNAYYQFKTYSYFYMFVCFYLISSAFTCIPFLTEFMTTWLQWVSTDPMLSASSVARLWPSPPRTMGDCLRLPLSSAIIMIIIFSRGLIQLARAIKNKLPAIQSLYWTLLFTEGVVSKQPPPYPTSFDPRPDPPTHC